MSERRTKYLTAPAASLKAEATGELVAAFSIFTDAAGNPYVDSDSDVVEPSAFTDGQRVPMVYGHNWQQPPIGLGTVRVTPRQAEWHGRLFLATTAGKEAHAVIREMGDAQEYSWGFAVEESRPDRVGGRDVRRILKARVLEVSPVLVGANRDTHTVAVKASTIPALEEAKRRRVAGWRSALRLAQAAAERGDFEAARTHAQAAAAMLRLHASRHVYYAHAKGTGTTGLAARMAAARAQTDRLMAGARGAR